MIVAADPDSPGTEPPSLFALLAVTARRAPDGLLASFAAIGSVVSTSRLSQ